MKKLTLSVGLLMGVMSAKAQDTKYYEINLKYGDVLCLDLNDEKNRTRKVITTFFDGSTREDVLDSKDNVYFSPQGTVKVQVSKPRFFNKL